jgi:twitching motility protein PilJ
MAQQTKQTENRMKNNQPTLKSQRSWMIYLVTGFLIISLIFVAFTFFLLARHAQYEQEWISLATDVQVASQQLAKSAGEAASGNPDAFQELGNSSNSIAGAMEKLRSGAKYPDLPPTPPAVEVPMMKLNQTWDRMAGNASTILERKNLILELAPARATGQKDIQDSQQENTEIDVRALTERGAPSDLFEVRGAADEIFLDSRDIFDEAANLKNAIAELPKKRLWPSQTTGAIGLALMILFVWILVYSFLSAERQRAKIAARANKENQQAILKLLDEMSTLADGDLTVQATVTEDITGAIADAVNFAIEQLRELVKGIKYTAQEVASSAMETRTATSDLAKAAAAQAEQVGEATLTVQNMAQSFDTMAKRSIESSEVAHGSVAIAHTGGEKVRETIDGMDTIRDQIQQTSKRIKRLGESTQEIGDIVELISGFAEQTNVLALNAAIQAASAGGSGKGFAVVADEVQQLAESATTATRRIESLVQTIQTDTFEAVVSMESTITEVVSGARLAEDAGTALDQIERVSTDLSSLIAEISDEADTQSTTATEISELMKSVQAVSVQASEGSTQTAASVEKLAELVMQLSDSVTDFKLPEED